MKRAPKSEQVSVAQLDTDWKEFLARLVMRLKQFAGGQIEVTDEATGTVHRGKIRTAKLAGRCDSTRKIVVMMDWYAKQQDDLTWVVALSHEFPAGLLVHYDLIDLGNGRRLYFACKTMSELIVLYPMGDESLDPDQVIGLDVIS